MRTIAVMTLPRVSGILLHPTSLPGAYGIGDLGAEAHRFADFLQEAGQRVWQVLPLGPTGYGDSPYQSFSSFAGNPLLISPELLANEGLANPASLEDRPVFSDGQVDYGAVIPWKRRLLGQAYETFFKSADAAKRSGFETFCTEQASWLEDYSLFMALKESHGFAAWTEWEPGLALRDPAALEGARRALAREVGAFQFAQYQFFSQWKALREYCRQRGILIIGDIPIYVAHDSADVWSHRELFHLDENGKPTVVAGVPPDYFSRTGQLWGNPIYRWDLMAEDGFAWWVNRVRAALRMLDVVRIDHFRGFEAYWEVPAKARTAAKGRWVKGPCATLFEAFREAFGEDLPIIAENLGLITPEVEALRLQFGLPGMAVLQFAFGPNARSSPFPPHTFTRDLVAYTGTHDNDTLLGWWKRLRGKRELRAYIKKYFNTGGREFHWVCIRALMASVANMVVFPLQDVLGLGNEARMNRPGRFGGNWTWRCPTGAPSADLAHRLHDLAETYGRVPS